MSRVVPSLRHLLGLELPFALPCLATVNRSVSPHTVFAVQFLPACPMTAVPRGMHSPLPDLPEKAASVRVFLAELTYTLRALLPDTVCSPTSQTQPSPFLVLYKENMCKTVIYGNVFMGIQVSFANGHLQMVTY